MESLKNIFAVADLRKRVLFTLGLLAVYRVGGHIPTPGINPEALAIATSQLHFYPRSGMGIHLRLNQIAEHLDTSPAYVLQLLVTCRKRAQEILRSLSGRKP